MLDELRAFSEKFSQYTTTAALSCLRLPEDPEAWQHRFAFMQLRRLPNLRCPRSKSWMRYKVEGVSSRSIEEATEAVSDEEMRPFLAYRERYTREAMASGNIVCVVTMIICGSFSVHQEELHSVHCRPFTQDEVEAVALVSDWEAEFIEVVEEECGRTKRSSPHAQGGSALQIEAP